VVDFWSISMTNRNDTTLKAAVRIVTLSGCLLGLTVMATSATQVTKQTDGGALVAYPDGYRIWAHVKSALVSSRHPDFEEVGGFRHIYANAQALVGYRGGEFPDGSVIVVDWLEGREDNGMFNEGRRRRVDVMVKDRSRFPTTSGWGFERFNGDSRTERIVTSAATQCFACHSGQAARDLVFSKLRE
jgi:hypothetical protein